VRWNWNGAEEAYRRSLELNPGYASAHQWYGILLTSLGRIDEGIAEIRVAGVLDPLSPVIMSNVSETYAQEGDLDRALGLYERVMDLAPGYINARASLAFLYAEVGRESDAVELLLDAGIPSDQADALRQTWRRNGLRAFAREWLGLAEAASGRPCAPTEWFAAQVLVFAGDEEGALDCLELGYATRRYDAAPRLKVNSRWDPIRADPRFQAILEGMNLAD
jgi:tetratricopeptide (TPR) repeat protein